MSQFSEYLFERERERERERVFATIACQVTKERKIITIVKSKEA